MTQTDKTHDTLTTLGVTLREMILDQIASVDEDTKKEASSLISGLDDRLLGALTTTLDETPTITDAFRKLGIESGPGATGGDPEDEGRKIFGRFKSTITTILCDNVVIKSYCRRPGVTDITAASALVLGALFDRFRTTDDINLLLISSIVVRGGLNELCHGRWK